MAKKKYFVWMTAVVLAVAGCESLEDTYSDYSGDGMVQYVGKCTDVVVTPGWERLHVEWKNSLDPNINKIKVVCQAGDIVRDTFLEPGITAYDFKNMEDGSYQVDVYAVDEDGKLSLSDAKYGRPYTYDHEEIRSFSQGVIKHFFVGNNVVLFMDIWSDNFVNFELNYTGIEGEVKSLPLTEEVFAQKYYLLRDVDASKNVFITREGRVQDCPDLIVFNPYELTVNPVFSASFKGWMKEHYQLDDVGTDFVKATTVLEFDYDILSFEDILYFPNLEKLVLGKNRYLINNEQILAIYGDRWKSVVTDLEKSEFILGVAQELKNLKIERYQKHYIPETSILDIDEMGIPDLPELSYLSTTGWTIENSQEEYIIEDTRYPLIALLDNDYSTVWMPKAHVTLYTYDLTIDMQEEKTVNGIKITQAAIANAEDILPGTVQIETSVNGYDWEMFTHVQSNMLGNGLGEAALFCLETPKQARYVKVTVSDRANVGIMNIALGDIAVF